MKHLGVKLCFHKPSLNVFIARIYEEDRYFRVVSPARFVFDVVRANTVHVVPLIPPILTLVQSQISIRFSKEDIEIFNISPDLEKIYLQSTSNLTVPNNPNLTIKKGGN